MQPYSLACTRSFHFSLWGWKKGLITLSVSSGAATQITIGNKSKLLLDIKARQQATSLYPKCLD